MTDNVKWVAYVSNTSKDMGENPSVISLLASARVLKLIMTLNNGEYPVESYEEDEDTVFVLDQYLLGFAQSFQIGDYEIEIVAE